MPPSARVTFNLEDADLPDLVKLVSSITGRRFILPSKPHSIKATIVAPSEITAAEAYQAFLSILEINGLTLVPAGKFLKIVETPGIENMPIPLYTGQGNAPGDDRFITRMLRLGNVSAEDVAQLLGRFKSKDGNVTAYAPTNTLIITDTGTNIRRMLRIVRELDVSRTGEQIWIEPIHYANATELAKVLQEMFPVGQKTGGGAGPNEPRSRSIPIPPTSNEPPPDSSSGPTTVGSKSGEARIGKILPDERTNSLIVLATERAYLRMLEVIRELDKPQEGEGRVHVHYLQHGDAEDVSTTLSNLIGGSTAKPGGAPTPQQGGGDAGVFEGQIKVTAHKPSNALVITSSLHDYAALRKVIERLDAPRRQVFIEAVIMELAISRGSRLGVSGHGGVPDFPENGSLSFVGFNAQNSLNLLNQDTLSGLALGVRGSTIPESQQLIGVSIPALGVVLTALANSSDNNVLSTPHILAMDNQEAEISVGENVPLQTSGVNLGGLGLGALPAAGQTGAAGAAGLAGLAGLGGAFGAAPRQDVGTSIKMTPHINESDQIRLDITEEISEAGNTTEGTLGVRSITKRTAKTKLSVKDQQTVVIGGLMRDTVNTRQTKVPILGDIPVIGALFRRTEKLKQKTNLLLILTPYIVRSPEDLKQVFERKMRERQEFLDRYFVFNDIDYEPPIDYSRTRGLLAEISNEMRSVDTERALMEEAQIKAPNAHLPQKPLGSMMMEEIPPDEESAAPAPTNSATEPASPETLDGTAPPQASPKPADFPQSTR